MSKETSEEMAKLAAFILQLEDDELAERGMSIPELLAMARQLAGSVLSQFEEDND
jgi:hypothetical protein